MRRGVWLTAASLAWAMLFSGHAVAGDKVLYAPLPDWVSDSGKLSGTEIQADGLVLLDEQQKADKSGLISYVDVAVHANSTQELAAIGTISTEWFPDKGDLIIHRIQIIRDGHIIDVSNQGKSFTILHREKDLEAQVLDGKLTATMQVDGLKVGDILRYSYSIRFKEPVFGDNVEAGTILPAQPFKLTQGRYRLIWPEGLPLNWRVSTKGINPVVTKHGDFNELTILLPLPKQPDPPPLAPLRFTQPNIIEASSFTKWEDISAAEAKVFAEQGLIPPGSSLAARVAEIAAKSPDPLVRTAEAVRMVQDDIRYFENGQIEGNLVPQAPVDTWEKRYGDCKAKALLLTAVLRALGVEAVPALTHASEGDLIPTHLPSFSTFDHMITRAVIAGKVYWLDGTLSGTRLPDLSDTPPYHYALPIKPGGVGLEAIAYSPPARPLVRVDDDIDSSASIALPAIDRIHIEFRGPTVAIWKNAKDQLDSKKFNDAIDAAIRSLDSDIVLIGEHNIAFNDEDGLVTITAQALINPRWRKIGDRTSHQMNSILDSVDLNVNRAKPEWKDIAINYALPSHIEAHAHIHLPQISGGFQIENPKTLDERIGGIQVKYKTSLTGSIVNLDQSITADQYEMPANQLQAAQETLARAKSDPSRLIAPDDLPPVWRQMRTAYRAKLTKPIEDIFAAAIAQDPDEPKNYLSRAAYYVAVDDKPAAIADLTKAIELKPTAEEYLRRANLYKDSDPTKAVTDVKSAQAIEPGSIAAVELLTRIYLLQHDPDAALREIDAVLPLQEDTSGLKEEKAEILVALGKNDQAFAIDDQIVDDTPGKSSALNARCWVKALANADLPNAVKDCSAAIEQASAPANIYDSRGFIYYRMHRYDDAITDFNAAIRLNPQQAPSLYVRGLSYIAKGQTAEGKKDIDDALTLEPDVAPYYALYGVSRPQ